MVVFMIILIFSKPYENISNYRKIIINKKNLTISVEKNINLEKLYYYDTFGKFKDTKFNYCK